MYTSTYKYIYICHRLYQADFGLVMVRETFRGAEEAEGRQGQGAWDQGVEEEQRGTVGQGQGGSGGGEGSLPRRRSVELVAAIGLLRGGQV